MSWSISIPAALSPAVAKTAVGKQAIDQNIPAAAVAVIKAAIEALPVVEDSVISVVSHGYLHNGDDRAQSTVYVEVKNWLVEQVDHQVTPRSLRGARQDRLNGRK